MSRHLLSLAAVLLSALPAWASVLAISSQQATSLGIRTEPLRAADTQVLVSVLGHVAPAADARVHVPAPFAGTVERLLRLEGASVKKGEPLAVIASSAMYEAQAQLEGRRAQDRMAKAAAVRAAALVHEGIAPASRAEQASAAAAAADADLAASRRTMAQAVQTQAGGYRLLAPVAGRVVAIAIAPGDRVETMQPVLSIDTRNELWVEGELPAHAVGMVGVGDGVVVDRFPHITGTVVAVGGAIDPHTRSAMVRARLVAGAPFVSGQAVRFSVVRKAAAGAFNVPRTAVVSLKHGHVVFVGRPGGFEPIEVRVLAQGPLRTTITGSLDAHDVVAVAGVSELKAASQRN